MCRPGKNPVKLIVRNNGYTGMFPGGQRIHWCPSLATRNRRGWRMMGLGYQCPHWNQNNSSFILINIVSISKASFEEFSCKKTKKG